MKVIKNVILELLLLIVMLLCSTVVMKLFDVLFKLDYENIWRIGFKVGFIAWLCLLVNTIVINIKNKKSK